MWMVSPQPLTNAPLRALWRPSLVVFLIGTITACGTVDYEIKSRNLTAPGAGKERQLGVVYFHYADEAEPYEVRLTRIKGGYAFQAPLYEDADGSNANIVASRTKELQYFIGVKARYVF